MNFYRNSYFLIYIFGLFFICYPDNSKFINPGIKIGYEFGNQPGITFGLELSYVMMTSDFVFGRPVLGVTKNIKKNNFIPYFELEGGFSGLGVTYGIEWDRSLQSRIRLFVGTGVYFSYLIVFNNFNEINTSEFYGTLKYPIILKDNGFNLLNIKLSMM
jgi:hypothetical protein